MDKSELELIFKLFIIDKNGNEEVYIDEEELPNFPEEIRKYVETVEEVKIIRATEICNERIKININDLDKIKGYYFEPKEIEKWTGRKELIRKFENLKSKKLCFVATFVEPP